MARALLVALLLLTCGTLYLFIAKIWWMPTLISTSGTAVDRGLTLSLLIVGIVFALAQVALGFFSWRFHGADRARYSTGHTRAEIIWTVLTALTFIALSLTGERTWADMHNSIASDEPFVQVEAIGTQFVWYFHYPGPDRAFGRLDPRHADASLGSSAAIGLDPSDPASKDDFVSPVLVVPRGRGVRLQLRAQDVIHSFFVPELRLKQDAVPGLDITTRFDARKLGDYEIACAELCGLGHYRMHATLRVVSPDDYAKWVAQQHGAAQ